jgi:hypothetical protein
MHRPHANTELSDLSKQLYVYIYLSFSQCFHPTRDFTVIFRECLSEIAVALFKYSKTFH